MRSSRPARYAIASVAGYVTFIALLRAWIAWQRGSWPDLDVGPKRQGDFLPPFRTCSESARPAFT